MTAATWYSQPDRADKRVLGAYDPSMVEDDYLRGILEVVMEDMRHLQSGCQAPIYGLRAHCWMPEMGRIRYGYYIADFNESVLSAPLNGSRVVVLPDAVARPGGFVEIIDRTGDAGTTAITVKTLKGQTVNGSATFTVNKNNMNVGLRSDGENWHVISQTPMDPSGNLDLTGIGILGATRLLVDEQAAPDTPASGEGVIYAKTDGNLYFKNDAGTEVLLIAGDVATGVCAGGVLSVGTPDTTFSISDGHGYVVDSTTNPPTVTTVTWSGKTNVSATYIGSGILSYISIDSSGNVVQSATRPTPVQRRTQIFLGVLVHVNLANINTVNQEQQVCGNTSAQARDIMDAIGFLNTTGNVYSANGANLNIDKSVGTVLGGGANWATSQQSPNILTLAALTAAPFQYRLYNGDNHTGLSQTDILPDILDNGTGTPSTVNNNKFTIQRIYSFLSNAVKIQPGQTEYSSIDDAIAAVTDDAFVVEPSILDNGIYRAALVVKKGATDLSDTTQARFISVGKFGLPSVAGTSADHGSLNGLADDDHTIYTLLAGRAGGQTITGGTGGAEELQLKSNTAGSTFEFEDSGLLRLPATGKLQFGTTNDIYIDSVASTSIQLNINSAAGGIVNKISGTGQFTVDDAGGTHFYVDPNAGTSKFYPTGTGFFQVEATDTRTAVPTIRASQFSTGDAYYAALIDGGRYVSFGLDNDDGDAFKMCEDLDLADDCFFESDSSGNVTLGAATSAAHVINGDVTVNGDSLGVTTFSRNDTGTTTMLDVYQQGAGSAVSRWRAGAQIISAGIDNSDGDDHRWCDNFDVETRASCTMEIAPGNILNVIGAMNAEANVTLGDAAADDIQWKGDMVDSAGTTCASGETLVSGGDGSSVTCSAVTAGSYLFSAYFDSTNVDCYQDVLPFQSTCDGTLTNRDRVQVPSACTVKNLRVEQADDPGAGETDAYEVYDDGAATGVTCSVTNTNTTCSDTSNTAAVAAGSKLTLFYNDVAGSDVTGEVHFSFECVK